MSEIYNKRSSDAILAPARDLNRAAIFEGNTQRPFAIQKFVIDLTTARLESNPFKISMAFRSMFIQTATDVNVSISAKPTTEDSYQSAFLMKQNDSIAFDYPIPSLNLFWDAQSGKTITLILFTNAEFRSGSQISVTGGGVSITEGSSFTQAAITLVAGVAQSIFASDSTRKVGVFQNKTGASVWVGNSSVAATTAFYEIAPGAEFIWKNAAQLYAISAAGGAAHKTEEF